MRVEKQWEVGIKSMFSVYYICHVMTSLAYVQRTYSVNFPPTVIANGIDMRRHRYPMNEVEDRTGDIARARAIEVSTS